MSDDATKRVQERLLRVVEPHANAIAAIWADGEIAVLVENPSAAAREALGVFFDWDGQSPVFPFAEDRRLAFAADSRNVGDTVTHAWLTEVRRGHRLFVCIDDGTLLLNFEDSVWSFEPGSTGGEGLI